MKFLLRVTIMVFLMPFNSTGQAIFDGSTDFSAIDESIQYGVLDNGLTYYIKPMKEPQEELKMTLWVKVGSSYEEPHEIDFAHHVEHLAFRETRNFPNGLSQNSKLLSRLEMEQAKVFGITGGHSTSYLFDPPTGNWEAIEIGLLWFKDIATGLDVSKKNIDRERGVLLQEFLAGEARRDFSNAVSALESQLFTCATENQNFVQHNKNFPYQDLQSFYYKWYRPDQMAVGIVGNLDDVQRLEEMIRQSLGGIKAREESLIKRDCGEGYFKSNKRFSLVRTNSSSTQNFYGNPILINMYYRDHETWRNHKNLKGIKRRIKGKLLSQILNRRLKEKEKVYDNIANSFSTHTFDYNGPDYSKPLSALKINIRTNPGDEQEALQRIVQTLKQLKEHGVFEEELAEVKRDALKEVHPRRNKNPKHWLQEIEYHFVYGQILPAGKNNVLRNWIRTLSKDSIQDFMAEVVGTVPDDIGVIIPENYHSVLNNETETRKLLKDYFREPAIGYQKPEAEVELMSKDELDLLPVQRGSFTRELGEMDSRIYQFQNGVNVILKPLDSSAANSNISLHGFTPNGAGCFPEDNYYSAIYSPSLIKYSGVGNLTKFDLERFYRSTGSLKMGISPYINYSEAGIKAEASQQEFEKLLQLVYLFFTKPRKDRTVFDDWKSFYFESTAITTNSVNDLLDGIQDLTRDYSRLPYASNNIAAVKSVDFEKAYEIYRLLFNQGGEFTFIITGNFNEEEMAPLLEQYLANLPSDQKLDCAAGTDRISLPEGPISRKIATSNLYKTQNSYYGLNFVRRKNLPDHWQEEIKVRALGRVARRMIDSFRTEEGLALYHFAAGGKYNRIMNRYELVFRFNCVPEELPVIKKLTYQTIDNLKKGNVSNEVLDVALRELHSLFSEDYQKQASRIEEKFYRHHRFNEPLVESKEIRNYLQSLTIEDLAETARRYFQDDFLYELVMTNGLPEN